MAQSRSRRLGEALAERLVPFPQSLSEIGWGIHCLRVYVESHTTPSEQRQTSNLLDARQILAMDRATVRPHNDVICGGCPMSFSSLVIVE